MKNTLMRKDLEDYKISDITNKISCGCGVDNTERNGSLYPYYGSNGIIDMVDKFNFDGENILVARKGTIVYNKSFGYHTYEKVNKLENNHIFDLSSITKILATMPLVLQEFDKDNISLETNLSELFPKKKLRDKADISLKEMLSQFIPDIDMNCQTNIVLVNKIYNDLLYIFTPINNYDELDTILSNMIKDKLYENEIKFNNEKDLLEYIKDIREKKKLTNNTSNKIMSKALSFDH